MSALKTLLAFIVSVSLLILLFVYSGIYDVAADAPHSGPVRWLLETTRSNSVDRRDDRIDVPADLSSTTRLRQGATAYAAMCQMCHLGPGIEPTPLHKGLNPKPPRLSEVAGHHSPGNLFWIIKHGFKMSAMPAWGNSHDDQELWNIVAFVQELPKLTPQAYKQLAETRNDSGHGHSSGK